MQLTIITPTYNSQETILRCVESVKAINSDDVEHLIIDGESKDNTKQIVEKFSIENKHIRLYSSADSGVYDAMNKGIKLSKGKWLYFLGSDDEFILDNVISLLNSLDKYDFIYGNVRQIKNNLFIKEYGGEFDMNRLANHNICHQAIFYKRSLFSKYGFYNLKFKLYADYKFNLTCFIELESDSIKYLDRFVANYNIDGISSKIEMVELIEIWESLLKNNTQKINRNAKKYILNHIYNFYKIIYQKDFTNFKYVAFLRSFFISLKLKIKIAIL
jgi:glycosyltransferase involved in cell wall biosynthesis